MGGTWCPEIDLLEANRDALQVTPHKCDPPNSQGYYSSCDRGGCAQNTYKLDPNAFGPGGQYTIDTTRTFVINTTFAASSGTLSGMYTTLAQGSNTFKISHTPSICGSGYLSSLSDVLSRGMTVVFTSWGDSGSSMSWLDVPPCSASTPCNANPDVVTFSNIGVY